ncbi:MAG: hypothetical protein GF311_00435 [Candidatus Lokiarchaeota archaeon]|nr:hypothetical protein [Candidatus Lokiarchaeota archaeon]
MNRKNSIKTKKTFFSILLLLVLTTTSLLALFSPTPLNSSGLTDQPGTDPLKTSSNGEALWWNATYKYRSPINITNPYSQAFTDFTTFVTIDYQTLVASNKIQASLNDIRIIKDGSELAYYVKKDYNHSLFIQNNNSAGTESGTATVWFETDIAAGASTDDTYIYYGSDNAVEGSTYMSQNPLGIAWYSFEDFSGGFNGLPDEVGDHNAEVSPSGGSPGNYQGIVGSGFVAEGDNNNWAEVNWSLSDPDLTAREQLTPISVSVWFKQDTPQGGTPRIVTTDGSNFWALWLRNGRVQLDTNPVTGNSAQLNGPTINQNEWYHIVFTYNPQNGAQRIYYNGSYGSYSGTQTGEDTRLGAEPGQEDLFVIAQNCELDHAGSEFDGVIDELRVFRKELSQNEADWIYNNYLLETSLEDEQDVGTDVTVIIRDVDGRRISGAEVFLWDASGAQEPDWSLGPNFTDTADSNGEAIFEDVPFENYTISVNYTLTDATYGSRTETVFNSSNEASPYYEFTELSKTETIYANLWTIDFEVVDVDGYALNYGYIVVNDTTDTSLAKLDLNEQGTAQFVWLNDTSYNYDLYYENDDFAESPMLLNSSTISRDDIIENYDAEIDGEAIGSDGYRVRKDVFLNERTYEEVVEARLEFINMNDNISELTVYYWEDVLGPQAFNEDYTDSDRENLSLSLNILDDSEFDDIEGIRFSIIGQNTSVCLGNIEIILTHTYVEHINTGMAKLNITVRDDVNFDPMEGITVKIFENGTTTEITESTQTSGFKTNEFGTALGKTNNIVFWYRTGTVLNITLWWTQTQIGEFYVNSSDQNFNPSNKIGGYNYTLNGEATIILKMFTQFGQWRTNFAESNITQTSLVWGENFTIWTNFTFTQTHPSGYSPDDGSGSVTCFIYDALTDSLIRELDLNFIGDGNYSIEIDSGTLSAGYSSKNYRLRLFGFRAQYQSTSLTLATINISAISTGISLHNYSTGIELNKVANKYQISLYYGQTINISIKYFESSSGSDLEADKKSYTWDYGSGTLIEDQINPEYFVLEFDSSLAAETSKYTIEITIGLENHTEKANYEFNIIINDVPTTINGESRSFYTQNKDTYITSSLLFTFQYQNSLDSSIISDLDLNEYTLYELDEQGNPIIGSGIPGTMTYEAGYWVIDADTENLPIGNYQIEGFMQKENYQLKAIVVTLDINPREITFNLLSGSNRQVSGVQGENILVKFQLTDPTNGSLPLEGANLILEVNNKNYSFTSLGNGEYQVQFPTGDINAFIQPQTLTGTVYGEKTDYVTDEYSLTIVVGMTEIFPGFPMFYFLMIIIGVGAVAGSLATYRYVQVARIPDFIKKSRAIKKEIKGGKSISEKNLYPSKEEFIAEMYGEDWEQLGLSLEEKLGLQGKKGKRLNKSPEGGAQ